MKTYFAVAALAAAALTGSAQARGLVPTPPAPVAQTMTASSNAPFFITGRGLPFIASAKERAAQQLWWAMRAERGAQRRMAACVAMPECQTVRSVSRPSI